MKRKEQELNKEQETKMELLNKIKTYESKLLAGGKNVIDHTNEQERKLQERRAMLAEEKRREIEMQQKLEKQEESNLDINKTFTSLQQEVDFKTKKLKKYFAKLQSLKSEIKDLAENNSKERQELEQTQTELQRDLKLRQLIIENFIPAEEKEKLYNRFYYDPDESAWKTKTITKEKYFTHLFLFEIFEKQAMKLENLHHFCKLFSYYFLNYFYDLFLINIVTLLKIFIDLS